MRRNVITIFTVIWVLTCMRAQAQDGIYSISAQGGLNYKSAIFTSLSLNLPKKYAAAHEISANYYRSFGTDKYENLLIGFNVKPVLGRGKNSLFYLRAGAYAGTDLNGFTAAPNIGFQWVQSLSPVLDFTITNNNGVYFWTERNHRWRATGQIGLQLRIK